MKIIALIVWIIIAFIPGFLGSIFTMPNIQIWYTLLNKPAFNPPNWLFGPAWTTLYLLMGIAAYLVWSKGSKHKEVRFALTIFLIQLVFNGLWSFLFFGQHWLLFSFMEIIILWLLILWAIIKFYRISRLAGILLVPYLLWVSFASLLNFSIFWLNR